MQTPTAIIGAGGIGSNFCQILDRLIEAEQVPARTNRTDFTVFDFDVVERKNLKHQDFEQAEIGMPKSLLMSLRYEYKSRIAPFEEAQLNEFQSFIICADNPQVRRIVFEHAKAHGKPFIDMRCEGDMTAVYTNKVELDELLNSLGEDKDSKVGRSCQLQVDVNDGKIQLGNFHVPVVGAQILLRSYRKEDYPAKLIGTVA